jgi:hypothetical protein
MRKNSPKWKALVPLLFVTTMVTATTQLTVVNLNGTEQQFALLKIGKITFSSGKMYLYDHGHTLLDSAIIDQIQQITMNEKEVDAVEAVNSQIRVFADPAQQQILVEGLPENKTLRVYDTMGRLLITANSLPDLTRINVSNLSNGTYLLLVGVQVVKFVKQ